MSRSSRKATAMRGRVSPQAFERREGGWTSTERETLRAAFAHGAKGSVLVGLKQRRRLLTTLLLYQIATRGGQTSVATMLLAGIAIAALAGAVTGILIYMADDKQLRDVTFWSLGSLSGMTWVKLFAAGPIILIAFLVVPFLSRGLNAITLGEAAAFHMGVKVQRLKYTAVVAVAGAVGASVAVSGGIGFVGIVVPHLLRIVIGPDHRYLLPASALLGGVLMLGADMLARTIVAPAELPIGIITALAGAPFFLWVLLRDRTRNGW